MNGSPKTTYLVVGQGGQWDDDATWIVAAFTEKSDAERWRDRCTSFANIANDVHYSFDNYACPCNEEYRRAWEDKTLWRQELIYQTQWNPYDPHMTFGDECVYRVVPLAMDPDRPPCDLGPDLRPLITAVKEFEAENDDAPTPDEFDRMATEHGVTKTIPEERKRRIEAELNRRGLLEDE